MYNKKHELLRDKQQDLNMQLEDHTNADHSYHIQVTTVLNLSRKIREIFESSEIQEKRQILNYILQNPTVNGKKLEFTMAKPFNLVLELANCPTWLPRQDSNLRPIAYIYPKIT
ncbi:MAG: hypothetical protein RLY49_15 [Candidatus Parcubacteria bacterium]